MCHRCFFFEVVLYIFIVLFFIFWETAIKNLELLFPLIESDNQLPKNSGHQWRDK